MTHRDTAIELMLRLLNQTKQVTSREAVDLVDALIGAANEHDTPHARSVAQMAMPLPPGSYRDGIGVPRCLTCHRIHPCPDHYPAAGYPAVEPPA